MTFRNRDGASLAFATNSGDFSTQYVSSAKDGTLNNGEGCCASQASAKA
ncbi:hypothetical protein SAMCFNEI73_pC1248 (plasmid) [Sinorhizobium americanum]|uniref:Uncharacterized protein n=1 Tax=Sinorhizobium americanum TaxID=194963 RepID=A0A1L3LY37_9HYPH|nr:hypothetical protein SAMCFNEI73_pC1248 [Sinorhizobium americanum]